MPKEYNEIMVLAPLSVKGQCFVRAVSDWRKVVRAKHCHLTLWRVSNKVPHSGYKSIMNYGPMRVHLNPLRIMTRFSSF